MQFEGFVDVVFPDDALGVVLLEPVPAGLGQLDLRHIDASSIGVSLSCLKVVFSLISANDFNIISI